MHRNHCRSGVPSNVPLGVLGSLVVVPAPSPHWPSSSHISSHPVQVLMFMIIIYYMRNIMMSETSQDYRGLHLMFQVRVVAIPSAHNETLSEL